MEATTCAAARLYRTFDWYSIPIPPRSKIPVIQNWPSLRLENPDEGTFNGGNIGVLLGEVSNVADADVDSTEAIALADEFLPPTGAIFGRASKPRSHRLYAASGKTVQFRDPTINGSEAMLVEVRGSGAQTVFPPSVHPSGEAIAWESVQINPARVEYSELIAAARELASAALLRRHRAGSRHDLALRVSGSLARAGWPIERTQRFLAAIVFEPEKASDRERCIDNSYERLAQGQSVASSPEKCFDDPRIWPTVVEWLGLRAPLVVEEPRPLRRPVTGPQPFPTHALRDLKPMACAVQQRTQAPMGLVATSTLAAANLVTQPFADVLLPTGELRPISEFFVIIGESGERKSAADRLNLDEVRRYERERELAYEAALAIYRQDHAAWEGQQKAILRNSKEYPDKAAKVEALRKLGSEPEAPLVPQLLTTEPTFEGLTRLFKEGHPSIGLFTEEGGQFIGGSAMRENNQLKTAGAFSGLWDGTPIRRTRQGDGAYMLYGRRLAACLLMQPRVAALVFSNEVLADQGLLSRILATSPESAIGTRPWQEPTSESLSRSSTFSARVRTILETPQPLMLARRNELNPRALGFDAEASDLWVRYVEHNEAEMRRGGPRENIRGLANKLPEHAARIAATLALFADLKTEGIQREVLADAITIAEFYGNEALRIRDGAGSDTKLEQAEALRRWLSDDWQESVISLPDIYQFGSPRSVRSKEAAMSLVAILADHGWLVPASPQKVAGKFRRQVWTVIREEEK